MARAGQVVAGCLSLLEESVRPGVTTAELDELAEDYIRSHDGYPTFKGYKGYPAATCLSPNDMVVHGIPNGYALADGDILSVDVGVTLGEQAASTTASHAIRVKSSGRTILLGGASAPRGLSERESPSGATLHRNGNPFVFR